MEGGVPLVSFGAPPDDRMSIATSEGESDQSGDDGSVPLPPSGRSAVPDSDLEMVAMLARAAESVGLEWRPPRCPEPSRLDDWFLGVARAGSQGPTPVPFFPEVHDELTGTWTAPFTARNRSGGSSSLATLDGGAARGYTEVPPVERSVAMQLCPRTASTWRGNPLLPSRACRHSSALTGSAYAACGEAASALHTMALLQVHQAKALRDLHEGGHDPGFLSELRTATDLALQATKVTARSLGRAMSSEGSGCPHLASRDRSPTGEGRDRASPSSRYEVRVLQPLLHCTQERRWVKTDLGSARLEPGPSQAPIQNAHTETHLWVRPSPRLVCSDRPEGRVLPRVDPSTPQAIPAVCVRRTGISIQSPALRAIPVAPCLHESSGGSPCSPERTGRAHSQLP